MSLKFLSNAGFTLVLSLALLPGLFALGPWLETRFFPVVENVAVQEVTPSNEGVSFYVSFDKVRRCEFVGVAWYNGPIRVGVEFEPGAYLFPRTRPQGDQFAGPWLVRGVSTLEDTMAIAIHQCHPLWHTQSPFYP